MELSRDYRKKLVLYDDLREEIIDFQDDMKDLSNTIDSVS